MLQTQHFISSNIFFPLIQIPQFTLAPLQFNPPSNPPATTLRLFSAHNHRTISSPWPALAAEDPTPSPPPPEDGPVELPSTSPSLFASSDSPTPLQTATSVLLTGAISVFLFRSLRRRAKRAKELKLRSSGAKKTLKEEALESLKAITPTPVDAKGPPSPVQTLLGALTAGVIALILYKFTATIESSLNRQTLSDNYSVRQITITIRTIVNGLCYLATFVFGINSVGLFLYSGQLAINSLMGDSSKAGDETQLNSPSSSVDDSGARIGSDESSSDKNQ